MERGSIEWDEPLASWMIEAVHAMGFQTMTPVQASAIPLLAGNKDVVAEAVTGSGKTMAFLIPALIRLERIEEPLHMGQTNVIIVEPTRELAYQTYKVLGDFLSLAPESVNFRTQLVTGGNQSSRVQDIKTFLSKKPHILVATPGRLLDILEANHVNMKALDLLVFDEGDRLLEAAVDRTIPKILSLLPKQKRAALFSATMNADSIADIVKMGMRNPVKVKVTGPNQATPDRLKLQYVNYGENPLDKVPLALKILRSASYHKAIVYIPTCTSVTFWYHIFKIFLVPSADEKDSETSDVDSLKVYSMHGKLPQNARLKVMEKFSDELNKCILLTTDVAARGLDIPGVDFVLQLDPPTDPNMFVHRAGRAGRAGKSGVCIVLLNGDLELGYVDYMRVRNVPLEQSPTFSNEKIDQDESMSNSQYREKIQEWIRTDRAHHDLALRSFLSFVRYYLKHTATSIFRLKSLNLLKLAESYGILRMPRMPELKNTNVPNDGWLTEPFDMDTELVYADPKQEKSRQEKLSIKAQGKPIDPALAEKLAQKKRNATAWSGNLERKQVAQNRREKRLKRAMGKRESNSSTFSDSDDEKVQDDWKEIVQQQRKGKKLKSNQITFDL